MQVLESAKSVAQKAMHVSIQVNALKKLAQKVFSSKIEVQLRLQTGFAPC